jgi:hypothetical protein
MSTDIRSYNNNRRLKEIKLLNSLIISLKSSLQANSCSVNISNNDFSLSWSIVHLSLFFTIISFENILSHVQFVTGIMVNIFNINYVLLKMSKRPLSFNQSNHTYTNSLNVP